MRSWTEAYINGIPLSQLDERILVQKITESKPTQKRTAVTLGGGVGQVPTGFERTVLQVDIEFAIADIHDYEGRARILQAVNAWAVMGGALTVSYRPEQRLMVLCDDLIAPGDITAWTSTYKMTLKAYAVPYWEAVTPIIATAAGSDGLWHLYNPGTAESPLELTVHAQSATDSIVVELEGRRLAFAGLGMTTGDVLTISHKGPIMVGSIEHNGQTRDALQFRTPSSADELMLTPGDNRLTVTGSGVTLMCRGRWS